MTITWILQRVMALVTEMRLPQIDLKRSRELKRIRKLHFRQVEERVKEHLAKSAIKGFKPLHQKSDSDLATELLPIMNPTSENNHLINTYFDKIFVINMRGRHDRRLKTIQTLNRLGIKAEIFYADDGYDSQNLKEYFRYARKPLGRSDAHRMELRYKKKMIVGPGAWGYLKTYRRLLRHAIDKNYDRILCFDDDVIFHKEFHDLFETRLKEIPDEWKLLYLGATQHGWDSVENDELNIRLKDIFGDHQPYYYPKYTDGSFAIGINRSVFRLLLDEIEKMNCSFDSGPLREVYFLYPGQTFALMPNLVIADVTESDIGKNREQVEFAGRMRWDLPQYAFPFEYDLVSVIMPAFNAEKTIQKSIRSILMQTYRNLELIVADDGSSDSTVRIVEAVAKEDNRVRLVKLGSNMGCYCARNAALRVAKGRYIAIQDADDVSLEHRLERLLIPICAGQAEFTVAHAFRSRCSMDELDINDQPALAKLALDRRFKKSNGDYAYHDQPVLGLMTTVFKRELFEELGLFWENRFGADSEFAERILFSRKGIIFNDEDPTIQTYLSRTDRIDGVYKRINEVLVVSADMSDQNITGSYSKEDREEFVRTWRKRFRGEFDYPYPFLEQDQPAEPS